jgi:hypothetical protein
VAHPEQAVAHPEQAVAAAAGTMAKECLAWAGVMATAVAAGDDLVLAQAVRALSAQSIQCALHKDATSEAGHRRYAQPYGHRSTAREGPRAGR